MIIFIFYFQFNGVYEFHYPMSELEKYVPSLEEMEITVTATVGERFLDEVISSYTTARIFNSSVRIDFLGGSPQVFKPMMPFTTYVIIIFIITYHKIDLKLGLLTNNLWKVMFF